jgi:hypothetical protein
MMKKLLMSAALAAMALASTAFASPPSTAAPPGFDRTQIEAVNHEVSPVSQSVAATGTGAESALKVFAPHVRAALGADTVCWSPDEDSGPEILSASAHWPQGWPVNWRTGWRK